MSQANNAALAEPANTAATSFEITVHRAIDAALLSAWDELYAGLGVPTLFQHRAWYQAYLAAYAPSPLGAVFFVRIAAAGRTLGVLPFFYTRRQMARCVGLLWNTDMGVRDLPLERSAAGFAALQTALRETLPRAGLRWDILELHDVPAGTTAMAAFEALAGYSKLAIYHHDSNRLRSVAGGKDQCFSLISKDHIKKTRKKWRKLEEQGALVCDIRRDAEGVQRGFEAFLALEDAGWKGSQGDRTSLACDSQQRSFYENLLGTPYAGLQPCVATLSQNGVLLAVNLCIQTGDTLYMLKICYDDNYKDHSPGNLILLYLLEQYSYEESVDYISFITGGDWTHRWTPERIPVHTCTVYNKTVAGLLSAAAAHGKNTLRKLKHRLNKPAAENNTN